MAEIKIHAIGYFRGTHFSKSSLPRQGSLSAQTGHIEFTKGFDHKLALTGLDQMSHVWLIYYFHAAQSPAKPLVKPPRAPNKQLGVYATRAPYRPNKIGLTLARVVKIQDGKLFLSNLDLLDGTPILDIKPYVPESDQATNAKLGWIDEIENWRYELSDKAFEQLLWLKSNGLIEIEDVLEAQLGTAPLQPDRKRIEQLSKEIWVLAWRTWRMQCQIDTNIQFSKVLSLYSGYSESELSEPTDPYGDKKLHREFTHQFGGDKS